MVFRNSSSDKIAKVKVIDHEAKLFERRHILGFDFFVSNMKSNITLLIEKTLDIIGTSYRGRQKN